MGEALCRLFQGDDNIDLRAIAIKARHRMKRMERERGNMPFPENTAPPPPRPGGGGFRGGRGGGAPPDRLGLNLFGVFIRGLAGT